MDVLQGTYYAQSQCLKITKKVAFNIASEASRVYNLSHLSYLKMAKMVLASF